MCESKTNVALQMLAWQVASADAAGRRLDVNRHLKRQAIQALV